MNAKMSLSIQSVQNFWLPQKSVFIDSNILIYSVSPNDNRMPIAKALLENNNIIISTQVMNEFINVVLKKNYLSLTQVQIAVEVFRNDFEIILLKPTHISQALDIKQRLNYSYWDSLIIVTALASGVSTLYSEDMHHNQAIDGQLTIINPFK